MRNLLLLALAFPVAAHAAPLNDSVRIGEFVTQCTQGGTAGQFVELAAPVDQQFDGSMRLVVRDHLDGLVLDASGLFDGQADGNTWPAGKTWLLGLDPAGDSLGVLPDHVLPGAAFLDTLGGAIELYGGDAGATLIDRIAYGPGMPLARPLRGHSIEHRPDLTLVDDITPSPTNFAGVAGSGSGCLCPGLGCADTSVAGIRIEKIALTCANGDSSTHFLELRCVRPAQVYPFNLGLRATAPNGTILFDYINFMGKPYLTPWPEGRSNLYGTPALQSLTGVAADQAFPVTFKVPDGTTLMLYDAIIDRGPVQILTIGNGAELRRPPPGESLERIAGDVYGMTTRQQPRNGAGVENALTSCPCDTSQLSLGGPLSDFVDVARDTSREGGTASYDATKGTLYTRINQYSGGARVIMKERYRLDGPPSALPLTVNATYRISGSSIGDCPPHDVCVPTHGGLLVGTYSYVSVPGGYVGTTYSNVGTLQAQVLPGVYFPVSAGLQTGGPGSSAVALAQITFDLPAGYTLTTCHGTTFAPETGPVGVEEAPASLSFRALGANPAPTAPKLECTLGVAGRSSVALLDLRGRIVWQDDLGELSAGTHRIDLAGARALPAGVYWARLTSERQQAQLKLVLLGR